jgi:hypothetical protein
MRASKRCFPLPSVAAFLAAAVFSAMPLAPTFDDDPGTAFVTVTAVAKDGDSGGSGGGDSGGNGGSSGSGGGGSGSDGDRGGGDHGGNSGRGGDGHEGNDDSGRSGRGDGQGERGGPRGRGDNENAGIGNYRRGGNGEWIEVQGNRIEVTYPGGWKEGVRDGTFELKDPRGRTVVKRRATATDRARLQSLSR